MKSLMNKADLYRIPAAKSTVVLIRREQQILCQCAWDWMGSVEEWLPVCHQGLDFLDKLTLHNPQSLRCVDCHFWDVLFTQMLLARTEEKINRSTTGKCIKYVADSLFVSSMTIKLIFRNIWHSVFFCTTSSEKFSSSATKRFSISFSILSDASSTVSSFSKYTGSSLGGNSSSRMSSK